MDPLTAIGLIASVIYLCEILFRITSYLLRKHSQKKFSFRSIPEVCRRIPEVCRQLLNGTAFQKISHFLVSARNQELPGSSKKIRHPHGTFSLVCVSHPDEDHLASVASLFLKKA